MNIRIYSSSWRWMQDYESQISSKQVQQNLVGEAISSCLIVIYIIITSSGCYVLDAVVPCYGPLKYMMAQVVNRSALELVHDLGKGV
ncbi:uncharacterized protein LOC111008656 isoform X2 [Momordica charantia]|uniref:Uncharacterized protein LOC111008656 isoform X2 n=1 Tax=Momordica charantia TaxID=3673 RepID=A0A6J1C9B8_MOMCH|nr:uncharacterized protein LOC111008656 isoform X2 [Momordica charantia]